LPAHRRVPVLRSYSKPETQTHLLRLNESLTMPPIRNAIRKSFITSCLTFFS
jgi:hypothetical protein